MKAIKPIANIAESIENNHTTKGNKPTIPPPINNMPRHPPKEFLSEPLFLLLFAFKMAYPIGIAIAAMINPMSTSFPPGRPRSGALGS